jgi:hypothetical protein
MFGMSHDAVGLRQSKKGQGETNDRLQELIHEQRETNRLLSMLVAAVTGKPVAPPAPYQPTRRR